MTARAMAPAASQLPERAVFTLLMRMMASMNMMTEAMKPNSASDSFHFSCMVAVSRFTAVLLVRVQASARLKALSPSS